MKTLILPLAAAAAFAAVAAPNALAATSQCAAAPTTSAFSTWGDPNQYLPFKGSSFESGASGWSWAGKANIVGADDAHLLTRPAPTPSSCPPAAPRRALRPASTRPCRRCGSSSSASPEPGT